MGNAEDIPPPSKMSRAGTMTISRSGKIAKAAENGELDTVKYAPPDEPVQADSLLFFRQHIPHADAVAGGTVEDDTDQKAANADDFGGEIIAGDGVYPQHEKRDRA